MIKVSATKAKRNRSDILPARRPKARVRSGERPGLVEQEKHVETEALAFLGLLRSVERGLRLVSRDVHPSLGLRGSDLVVLRMVGDHPGLSAGDLARLLHLNASSMTGTIERLVQRRLLARSTDPKDRRRDVLALTPTGRRAERQRTGTVESRIERALARLSAGQLAAAAAALQIVARELSTL